MEESMPAIEWTISPYETKHLLDKGKRYGEGTCRGFDVTLRTDTTPCGRFTACIDVTTPDGERKYRHTKTPQGDVNDLVRRYVAFAKEIIGADAPRSEVPE